MARLRVTVVGAGVMGLSAALELAERGADVDIVERAVSLGATSCSRLAGGMLAPWCERESAEAAVTKLGRVALGWWPRRYVGTRRRGTLVVAAARDAAEVARFARRTTRHVPVDATRIAELEPDLAGRFRHGLYFEHEAHVAPARALAALAERLDALGVPIRFGVDGLDRVDGRGGDGGLHGVDGRESDDGFHGVDGRESDGGLHDVPGDGVPNQDTDVVLDCRGFGARDVLPELRGVRGEIIVVRTSELSLSRPVRLLHPRLPLYVVPREPDLYAIGATMIESGATGSVTVRSALELLGAAYALHPAFGEAEIVELGAGVRPAFPDNLPRIVPRGRTLHLNGLYRHGFLLAPALARRAARTLLARHGGGAR